MGTKRWRPQLIALNILLAFVGFSYSYVRYFVRARTHSVIVFFVPGASSELLALAQARNPNRTLAGLDHADGMAFVESQSSDQLTGDAAALASFLATGQPSPAGRLSLRYDGKPADTLLYEAQRRGRAVGVVSSGPITSPGVAAFYSHQPDASVSGTVAQQLLDTTRIDLILGGGREIFTSEKKAGRRDLEKEAEKLDYTLVFDRAGLESFPAWNTRRLLGLVASDSLPLATAGGEAGTIQLADLVRRSIETLAYNLLGYFLVVDHPLVAAAAGQNQAELAVRQLHELDRAVETARKYAGKNTLILVYCPYAIGGFQFLEKSKDNSSGSRRLSPLSWHNGPGKKGSDPTAYTTGRVASPSAGFGWVIAFGRGSEKISGIMNPGELHAILSRQL
jgi:alkaline phosphatase